MRNGYASNGVECNIPHFAFMKYIHVLHPSGAAFGSANRKSWRFVIIPHFW